MAKDCELFSCSSFFSFFIICFSVLHTYLILHDAAVRMLHSIRLGTAIALSSVLHSFRLILLSAACRLLLRAATGQKTKTKTKTHKYINAKTKIANGTIRFTHTHTHTLTWQALRAEMELQANPSRGNS